jgi:hypothetical protein
MKDGSTFTCPPIDDPNIDHPIGELDQRVNVLRFDQDNGQTVVLYNYGVHVDCIGGEYVSPDFPGWVRSTLDKALDGVKAIYFPGCQGDVGSTNVHPKGGDMNDTEISFDNEMKSPGMARFVGRALAGTILQVFDKVEYIDVDKLNIIHKIVQVKSNKPTPEDDMEKDWADVKAVLDIAIDSFIERRNTEGEKLCENIKEKIGNIKEYLKVIEANSESDIKGYSKKLEDRILKFLNDNSVQIDEQRILTEVAILAVKVAIHEELV